jgi:hypothetical protein
VKPSGQLVYRGPTWRLGGGQRSCHSR